MSFHNLTQVHNQPTREGNLLDPFISLLGMFFSSDSKSFVLDVFQMMLTLFPSLVMVSMLLLRLDRSLCIARNTINGQTMERTKKECKRHLMKAESDYINKKNRGT
jgi:hypothetical protein